MNETPVLSSAPAEVPKPEGQVYQTSRQLGVEAVEGAATLQPVADPTKAPGYVAPPSKPDWAYKEPTPTGTARVGEDKPGQLPLFPEDTERMIKDAANRVLSGYTSHSTTSNMTQMGARLNNLDPEVAEAAKRRQQEIDQRASDAALLLNRGDPTPLKRELELPPVEEPPKAA